MKKLYTLLFCLSSLYAVGQNADTTFNGDTWVAPYTLILPKGWGYERFHLPPDFAGNIAYKGVEDLRFTPNWGNSKSDEYWTYAYLWYLDSKPIIKASILKNALFSYYSGLVNRNIKKRNIPEEKIVPMVIAVKKIRHHLGDLQTFTGEIDMLDYMDQKPIRLHCIVHAKYCEENDRFFLFFQLSPKPLKDKIWNDLELLWVNFNCAIKTETK